ncbi:MAG: TatD family hydrolase [bacterium]|nr:TatD family hydrolase [bacterium]
MELIDVHSHLQDKEFDKDREDVLENAKKVGVKKIITSTLDLKDAQISMEMFSAYKGFIYMTVGCNPCIMDEKEIEKIQSFVREKKIDIVGIGEIGLDYYWVEGEQREKQKEFFKLWINFAKEMNLPLIVHSRSAGKYAIEMLLEEKYCNVLMHSYDGKVGWAIEAAKQGFYFSIPPSIVNSSQKQKLVKSIDISRIMLESDAPVLGPEKDKRNEPQNLVFTVRKISEIKSLSEDTVSEMTTRNASEFFKI